MTFNANANDATAYNNYLMEESYLVVPTTGLTAAKAKALAQFVRFVLGSPGPGGYRELRFGTGHAGHGGGGPEGGGAARCRGRGHSAPTANTAGGHHDDHGGVDHHRARPGPP